MEEALAARVAAVTDRVLGDYRDRVIDNVTDLFSQIDREVVFQAIRDLLKVIYPGYYRDRNYKIYNLSNTLQVLLEDIMFHLSKQVYTALRYRNVREGMPDDREKRRQEAEDLTLRFLNRLPEVRAYLDEDLQAAFDGDPAAYDYGEIILSYPGQYAVSIYRLAHELALLGVPLIPRVMTEYAHSRTGIDIHPDAVIGRRFFIDHGTGTVIGQSTVIGNNVRIYQGVTLGALSTHGGQSLRSTKRHPTIGDNVTIYSNATILGGETVIGHDAVIGGNAFVVSSVRPYGRISVRVEEGPCAQADAEGYKAPSDGHRAGGA